MLANKIDIFVVQSWNGLKSDNKKWRNDIKPDQRDEKLKHDLRQRQSRISRLASSLINSIWRQFNDLRRLRKSSCFDFSLYLSISLSLSIYLHLFSLYFSLFLSLSFSFLPYTYLSTYWSIHLSIYLVCFSIYFYLSNSIQTISFFLSPSPFSLTSFSL